MMTNTQDPIDPQDVDLGIALSGGGARATLFTLGSLLYVVDSGLNRRTVAISSVSGGSITNAFVAQRCDFSSVSPDDFEKHAAELASTAVRGLAPRVPVIFGFGLLAVAVLLIVVGSWPVSLPWWIDICLIIALGIVVLLRGLLLAKLLERRVFGIRHDKLADYASRPVNHVICATDLNSSQPIYLTTATPHVFSPTWGAAQDGHGGNVPIGAAVRASTAFPGGLPPKKMRTNELGFRPTTGQYLELYRTLDFTDIDQLKPSTLYLADGGVWNNIGTDWFLRATQKQLPSSSINYRRPRQFVVADASAPATARRSIWYLSFPWLAELGTIVRVLKVQFASTVISRIDAFRVRLAMVPPKEDEWTIVARMAERPSGSATDVPDWPISGWAVRRRSGFRVFRHEKDQWIWRGCNRLHKRNSRVPTTIFRLPAEAGLDLLFQGYHCTRAALLKKGMLESVDFVPPDLPRLAKLVGLKGVQSGGNWYVSRRGDAAPSSTAVKLVKKEMDSRGPETESKIEAIKKMIEENQQLSASYKEQRAFEQEGMRLREGAKSAYKEGDFVKASACYAQLEEVIEQASSQGYPLNPSPMLFFDLVHYSIALGRCDDPRGLVVARRAEDVVWKTMESESFDNIQWYAVSQAYAVNGDVVGAIQAFKHTDIARSTEAATNVLSGRAFDSIRTTEQFRDYLKEFIT